MKTVLMIRSLSSLSSYHNIINKIAIYVCNIKKLWMCGVEYGEYKRVEEFCALSRQNRHALTFMEMVSWYSLVKNSEM